MPTSGCRGLHRDEDLEQLPARQRAEAERQRARTGTTEGLAAVGQYGPLPPNARPGAAGQLDERVRVARLAEAADRGPRVDLGVRRQDEVGGDGAMTPSRTDSRGSRSGTRCSSAGPPAGCRRRRRRTRCPRPSPRCTDSPRIAVEQFSPVCWSRSPENQLAAGRDGLLGVDRQRHRRGRAPCHGQREQGDEQTAGHERLPFRGRAGSYAYAPPRFADYTRAIDTLSPCHGAPGGMRMAVSVVLSEVQRAALAALCDTFAPAIERDDDPTGLLGAERVRSPDPGDHRGAPRPAASSPRSRLEGLRQLLDALAAKGLVEAPPGGARADRSRASWTPAPRRSPGSAALKGLTHLLFYALPDPQTGPQPELGGDRLPRSARGAAVARARPRRRSPSRAPRPRR